MKMLSEIHGKLASAEWLRWALIGLGAAAAALLAAGIETGRAHAQTAGSGFFFSEARVRVITPNGDQRNDRAILCFDNPKSSGVRGEIFDLHGRKVSEMTFLGGPNQGLTVGCPPGHPPVPNSQALTWDGRSNGSLAAGGIYVYLIQSEDQARTGTILVVR